MMKPSKILAFLDPESHTREEILTRFGEGALSILDTLVKEGSLSLQNDRYSVSLEQFNSTILSYQCGLDVRYVSSCTSTNDVANRLAQDGWTGVVTADFQLQGRGRLGRVWQSSDAENLLFSMVIRPKITIAQASRTTLIWAAEIADELGLYVKWPNDIIDVEDNKVGGLLSSMQIKGNKVEYIIFGVGLNVNQHSFVGLPQATSLAMLSGKLQSRNQILRRIIERVEQTSPSKDFSLWRQLSRTLGRRVKIGDVEGVATTIREDGALIVNGIPILTGDVQLMEGE